MKRYTIVIVGFVTIMLSLSTISSSAFEEKGSLAIQETYDNIFQSYNTGVSLFSADALSDADEYLDSINTHTDDFDFKIVFAVTLLSPTQLDTCFTADSLANQLAEFPSPLGRINEYVDQSKDQYNDGLIDAFLDANQGVDLAEHAILVHNIFLHPYTDGGYVSRHTLGVYSTANLPTEILGLDFCGSMGLTNTDNNDDYLLNCIDALAATSDYVPTVIDRFDLLTQSELLELDSITDTLFLERQITASIRLFPFDTDTTCIQNVYELNEGTSDDQAQILVRFSGEGEDLSYELYDLKISENLDRPLRYKEYVKDSINAHLEEGELYEALHKGIDKLRGPCEGDLIFNMAIVHNYSANNSGGMFGCARVGTSCRTTTIPNLPSDYRDTQGNPCEKVHNGMDVRAVLGTDIFSMYSGQVVIAINSVTPNTRGSAGDFGNKVVIMHTAEDYGGETNDPAIYSLYAHLNRVDVRSGNRVRQGQQIGQTGRTGNAVNIPAWRYHSHVNIYSGNRNRSSVIDPRDYFYTQLDDNGQATN